MGRKPRGSRVTGTLILFDDERMRAAELRAHQRLSRELAQMTAKLRRFEEQDQPAYRVWIASTIGVRVDEIDRLRAEVATFDRFLAEVRAFAAAAGVDAVAAFKKVARQRERPHRPRRVAFEEEPAGERRWREAETSRAKAADHQDDATIKSLYRRLVRALHPDLNPGPTDAERRAWHEVQDAYAWSDLARLTAILATVQRGPGPSEPWELATQTLSDLRAHRKALEKRLREVRRKLRVVRKEPAWGFEALRRDPESLERLTHEATRDLDAELADLRASRDHFRELVAALENGDERRYRSALKDERRRARRV